MKALPCVLALLVFPAASLLAGDLRVPEDYGTIMAAISAAQHGDRILVAGGTYTQRIDFLGKAVAVISRDGRGAAVIKSAGPVSVQFVSGEGPSSLLSGFRITGNKGSSLFLAAGILVQDSSPTIENNEVVNNGKVMRSALRAT